MSAERDYVLSKLAEIYTEDGCAIWMRSPNKILGASPDDLIANGEARRVLDLIQALAEGVVL